MNVVERAQQEAERDWSAKSIEAVAPRDRTPAMWLDLGTCVGFALGARWCATIGPEQIEAGLWAWIESAAEGVTRENVNPRVLDRNRPRMIAAARAMGFTVEGER